MFDIKSSSVTCSLTSHKERTCSVLFPIPLTSLCCSPDQRSKGGQVKLITLKHLPLKEKAAPFPGNQNRWINSSSRSLPCMRWKWNSSIVTEVIYWFLQYRILLSSWIGVGDKQYVGSTQCFKLSEMSSRPFSEPVVTVDTEQNNLKAADNCIFHSWWRC